MNFMRVEFPDPGFPWSQKWPLRFCNQSLRRILLFSPSCSGAQSSKTHSHVLRCAETTLNRRRLISSKPRVLRNACCVDICLVWTATLAIAGCKIRSLSSQTSGDVFSLMSLNVSIMRFLKSIETWFRSSSTRRLDSSK